MVVAIDVAIGIGAVISIIFDMAVPVIGATLPRLPLVVSETRSLLLDSRHIISSVQPALEFHEFRASLQLQRILLYHERRLFSCGRLSQDGFGGCGAPKTRRGVSFRRGSFKARVFPIARIEGGTL
jgi:hypothetical protein